jgi:hypothetical protein
LKTPWRYYELVVVVEAPGKCPVAPQALKAAWSVGLPAPPLLVAPAGGVPAGRVPVPLPGTWDGGVTPCFFRHSSSAVRVALEVPPAVVDVDVDAALVLLLELPQAAIARLANTTAASKSIRRKARR